MQLSQIDQIAISFQWRSRVQNFRSYRNSYVDSELALFLRRFKLRFSIRDHYQIHNWRLIGSPMMQLTSVHQPAKNEQPLIDRIMLGNGCSVVVAIDWHSQKKKHSTWM